MIIIVIIVIIIVIVIVIVIFNHRSVLTSTWDLQQHSNVLLNFKANFKTIVTSLNGNIFCVTGHLCEEFTGPGEFPVQRPLMFPLVCAWINASVNNREADDLRRNGTHYDVNIMEYGHYSLHSTFNVHVLLYCRRCMHDIFMTIDLSGLQQLEVPIKTFILYQEANAINMDIGIYFPTKKRLNYFSHQMTLIRYCLKSNQAI